MSMLKYKEKLKSIGEIAEKHNWLYHSIDQKAYRVSYTDESMYRIDIWLSKMTVGLLPFEGKPTFYKNQNIGDIERILENPMCIEMGIEVDTDAKSLDNKKREFTEADMWQFALDYMERFQIDLMLNGCVDPAKVDKFLTENIKKYQKNQLRKDNN